MREIYYQAAGGVVAWESKVLLLYRPSRNEVRLPKGHIEAGESPEEAALREVREETGYAHLHILADLGTQQVQFTDPQRARHVVRDERYFLMGLDDERQLARDAAEEQFVVRWVPAVDAVEQLTYPAEQEFMRRALRVMAGNGKQERA